MEQLGLDLTQRMSYSGAHFVPHEGVRSLLSGVELLLKNPSFTPTIIFSAQRFGKTHLSVHLVDRSLANGKFPKLIDAGQFEENARFLEREVINEETIVIVDDIDIYLKKVLPGQSGTFVHFWEYLRQRNAHLILFSSTPIAELPCDEHVSSRLHSANSFEIGLPADEDVEPLVLALAKQRGMRLSPRQVSFLKKRMRRDIPSLERYFDRLIHLSGLFGAKLKFELLQDAL